MTQQLARLDRYTQYNGFYTRSDVRAVVADLYHGKCALTNEEILFEDGEVGHIVPRSKPEIFAEMYPDVDIDNVINLHWIRKDLNRRNSNADNPSPLAIHAAIAYSSRIVDQRLAKLLKPKKLSKIKPQFKSVTDQISEKFGQAASDALSDGKTVWQFKSTEYYMRYVDVMPEPAALASLIDKIENATFPVELTDEEIQSFDLLINLPLLGSSLSHGDICSRLCSEVWKEDQMLIGISYLSILKAFADLYEPEISFEEVYFISNNPLETLHKKKPASYDTGFSL